MERNIKRLLSIPVVYGKIKAIYAVPVFYRMNGGTTMAEEYSVCLDIGGTKVLGAIFDEKEKPVYRLKKNRSIIRL